MKVAILCLILLFATSQAVGVHRSLTNAQTQRIENLRKSNSWGSALLNLAELHLLSEGPIDALVVAIQEVIADIDRKLTQAQAAFDKRTTEHNGEVRRLTDLINEAAKNIADTQELLANVLEPQKVQIIEEIANLQKLIADTKAYIGTTTANREREHEDFLVRIEEHNGAIAAIDEGLALLNGLLNGEPSLAQMKRAQKQVQKITQKIHDKNFIEGNMIKALLALTNTEFANSEAVQRVVNLMNDVKNNLQKSIIQESANEDKAQEDFKADMKRCVELIAKSTAELNEKTEQLARTEEQIENAHNYIEQRTADKFSYTTDLKNENDAYADATKQFQALVTQLTKEDNACHDALDVIQNATFEDYIGGRMSQDKVIDTAHGSGIKTGAGDFNFK